MSSNIAKNVKKKLELKTFYIALSCANFLILNYSVFKYYSHSHTIQNKNWKKEMFIFSYVWIAQCWLSSHTSI